MKHRKPHTTKPKLSPAQKEAIYALPLSKQFRIVHIDEASGFAVYQHVLVDTEANDYGQVLAVAKAYARETPCAINPEVDKNAPLARAKLFPGIESNANPDLITCKYGYIDVKSPHNKSNIVNNVNKACIQEAIANITDLMLRREEISEEEIEKFSSRIFSSQNVNHNRQPNYTQNEVHWFVGGRLYKCNRPEKN